MFITPGELKEHVNDYDWLDEHIQMVYTQVEEGLQYNYSAIDAIELLNEIMPYALTRLDYRRWEPQLYEALLHAMELKDDEFQIQIWAHLGTCFLQSGHYDTASDAFRNALAYIGRDVTPESGLLARIGILRSKMVFETSDISDFIAETLLASQQVGTLRLLGKLHYTLSIAYTFQAETRTAFGHGEIALACWHILGNEEEKSRAILGLAEICRVARRYEQAERYLNLLHFHAADVYKSAIFDYRQGSIALENDRIADACYHYQNALDQFKTLDFPQLTGAGHHALALAQTKLGEFDEARINLRHALIIWQQINILAEQANGVYALAFLEEKAENFAEARALYREALKLSRKLPPSPMASYLLDEITAHLDALSS